MDISFKTTDIPSIPGRVKGPNPYIAHAEAAVKATEQGKAIVHELGKDENVKTLTRLVREAGHAMTPPKTIRVRIDKNGKGVETGTVTLWAIPKIDREKKVKSETETEGETVTVETEAEKAEKDVKAEA